MKESNEFALVNITFAEIKAIKDASELAANSGSSTAKKVYDLIDAAMNEMTI